MKKSKRKNRNPIAAALRTLRPKVKPSKKGYKRVKKVKIDDTD